MKYSNIVLIVLLVSSTIFAAGKPLSYNVEGKKYEGYYISPSANAPLIILIHDWDGLTGYEVKRASMLAELGYAVFAVDLYGTGIRPTDMKDKRQQTGKLYNDRKKMRKLLFGALEAAKYQGGNIDNAIVLGYCFGGAAVLEFARSGANLKGFVSFHGGLKTPSGQDYGKTHGKLLILHGTADKNITMNDFATLAKELEEEGISNEMITYGGAPHAFSVFGSERYREDADKKSWSRFTQFLKENFK